MCGIAGFDLTAIGSRYVDRRQLTTALFKEIEHRGGHATGLAWYGRHGGIGVQKQPGSSALLTHYNFGDNVETAILHTRYATQGRPEVNRNNHPMIAWTPEGLMVAGVHNGCLDNDRELTRKHSLARYAETDSDVLFQMLAVRGIGNPSALEEVRGSQAIAYTVEQSDTLYLAKGDSSPLWFYQTPAGVVFSSVPVGALVQEYLDVARDQLGEIEVAEGQWCSVKAGLCDNVQTFEVPDRPRKYSYYTGSGVVSSGYYAGKTKTYSVTRTSPENATFMTDMGGTVYQVCGECLGFIHEHDPMCSHSDTDIDDYGKEIDAVPAECPLCKGEIGEKADDGQVFMWCRGTRCLWWATLGPEPVVAEVVGTFDNVVDLQHHAAVRALGSTRRACSECGDDALHCADSRTSGACTRCREDLGYPLCPACGWVLGDRDAAAGTLCICCEGWSRYAF